MPFVVATQPVAADKAIEATLCESNLLGQPDKRHGVPVQIRRISEQILLIDDDPREIVSLIMRDNTTTFAVGPGRKDFTANARAARLREASQLAAQLQRILTALPADNGVLNHIKGIVDWLKDEKL